MNDFRKKSKKSLRQEKADLHRKCGFLVYWASLHFCKFNASVLSFRDKQEFPCKTATVTFSFPCLRA